MLAMIVKEFRQLRRDRRTMAMMIVLPVVMLIVLGYAASFDVSSIGTVVAGPQAAAIAAALHVPFHVTSIATGQGADWAQNQLRDGKAIVAIVTGARPAAFIDGSQLFAARAALTEFASLRGAAPSVPALVGLGTPKVLFNPSLKTSNVMIPGLAGLILVFIGTIITSLGVVRERESGTLEQLAVMPLRPRDVYLGKVVPYFVVAVVDLVIVLAVGVTVFGVPFNGNVASYALGALLFLFATLGTGVLISSVSETQGQATQLALMATLPQVLLSGLIFPLTSITPGIRWISYVLPLTYFIDLSRGIMLRAESISALWLDFVLLAILGTAMMVLATLRFRAFLAPAPSRTRRTPELPRQAAMTAAEGRQ